MALSLFSHDKKADALGRAPLFHHLGRRELLELARVTEDLEFDAGKVLCREGETAREFFVLVEGEVEVTKGGRTIATLGPGDFFGEIALVEHTPRTATVTAKTPLRFFVLTSQAFFALMDSHSDFERTVLRTLAKRVLASAPDPTH